MPRLRLLPASTCLGAADTASAPPGIAPDARTAPSGSAHHQRGFYATPPSKKSPPHNPHRFDGILSYCLTRLASPVGTGGSAECGASAEGWRERFALREILPPWNASRG